VTVLFLWHIRRIERRGIKRNEQKGRRKKEGWMKGERCPNDPFAYQSREKRSSGTERSLSLNLDQMFEYKLNSGHISQLWHFMCLLYHTIRYCSIWPTDLCSSLPVIPASVILCCFMNYTCYWYWLRSLQLTLVLFFSGRKPTFLCLWPVTDVFKLKYITLKCSCVSWVWDNTVTFRSVLVWLELCVNFNLGLLKRKHLTNCDQWTEDHAAV